MPEKVRKEQIRFDIKRVDSKVWEYYKKYHYLTETLGPGHNYELTHNDIKVGFINIGRFPHPKVKNIMTINRVVIVPEFQGFGLGLKFIREICSLYPKDRKRITTSLKPFMTTLKKSKNWKCVRFGRVGSGSGSIHNKRSVDSFSFNRITASFEYIEI